MQDPAAILEEPVALLAEVRIGFDLAQISAIADSLRRFGRRFTDRLFTADEQAYALGGHGLFAERLAARFAAKEAFQKVWPHPHGWRDVWVERGRTPDGPFPFSPPVLGFAPPIAAELAARGWVAHLTLTHTKEHASAVVVLEAR